MSARIIIGIDIRDLKIARTGTKTYLTELCQEFKLLEGSRYKFYFFDTVFPVYVGEKKLFKWIEHLRYQTWKQLILPLKAWSKRCDIVFCTDNFVPYLHMGYQTVPVFHDAFFFENPEHYNRIWLWVFKKLAIPAAKRSPFVITPTYYAREQIHFHTKIDREKLIVIYEGPKSLSTIKRNEEASEETLTSHSFKNGQYILHVGVMNKRKNLPALIYAFKKLKKNGHNDLKLVLAGKPDLKKYSSDYDEILKAIKDCQLENDVVLTGYLSNTELSKVYSGALLYVFPSLSEGFGIPVLEAFYYQLPVLVANNTCLPEVGGDAVLTFDPLNIEDIYLKMEKVLTDNRLRNDLIEKGNIRLQAFSWKKTALSLLDYFASCMKQ